MINKNYKCKYVHMIINQNFCQKTKKKYKAYQRAIYHVDKDTDAWFGTICRDKSGNFVENKSCGWTNEDHGKKFIMHTNKQLTEDEKKRLDEENGKERLIFAKDKRNGEYHFYGVYKTSVKITKSKATVTCTFIKNVWP